MQTTEAPCANECQHCGGPIAEGDPIPVDLRSQRLVWRHADCQTFHLTGTATDGARLTSSSLARPDNGDKVAAAMGLTHGVEQTAPQVARGSAKAATREPDIGDHVCAAFMAQRRGHVAGLSYDEVIAEELQKLLTDSPEEKSK